MTAVAVALVVALLAGCSASDTGRGPGSDAGVDAGVDAAAGVTFGSGTIVRSGGSIWVASADDRSIAEVDPDTLATIRRIDLDGTPSRLLAIGTEIGTEIGSEIGSEIVVSFADRDAVAVVDGRDGDVRTLPVPCAAGRGLAAWDDEGNRVALACPVDGVVVVLDPEEGEVLERLAVDAAAGQPVEVVAASGRLTAAAASGALTSWDLTALDTPVHTSVPVERGRRASQLEALVATPAGPVAGYQIVDSERAADPTDPADTGSYASIVQGMARVEPAVSGWCPQLFSDFSRPQQSLSGISALAVDAVGGRLWVVGRFTGNVVVLDCESPARDVDGVARARVVETFEVGVGAAGIVLSEDGRTAWVDGAFDHAVVRTELDGGTVQRVRDLGEMSMSPQAQEGRRRFHDATDVHLTPNRVVTCASCHPGAGEDGLAWRISTPAIDRKYRRTPPLWGLSGGRLHWDGEYERLAELTRDTVHELLGGDGLLVDVSGIAAYLAETSPPPAAWNDGDEVPLVEAGRDVFATAGCAACHLDGSGSDSVSHEGFGDSDDPDAEMPSVRTPRLVGLAGRAGFLHDGSAPSLDDMLAEATGAHGTGGLSDEQRAALVAFLRSL